MVSSALSPTFERCVRTPAAKALLARFSIFQNCQFLLFVLFWIWSHGTLKIDTRYLRCKKVKSSFTKVAKDMAVQAIIIEVPTMQEHTMVIMQVVRAWHQINIFLWPTELAWSLLLTSARWSPRWSSWRRASCWWEATGPCQETEGWFCVSCCCMLTLKLLVGVDYNVDVDI